MVTWRRAQTVLLSAQGMPVAKIAEVTFSSSDRVRDVTHNSHTYGFDSLCPKCKGGRPRTFTLPGRREIKKIAKSKPAEHNLPFRPGAWSSWPTSWSPRGWSTTSALYQAVSAAPTPGGNRSRGRHRLAGAQRVHASFV